MYRIDRARRLVLCRAWGTLTNDDVRDNSQRVMADPEFDPSFRAISDLTDVSSVAVDGHALAFAAAMPLFFTDVRRAIVAPTDATFGIARMFASFAERTGHEVRVFRERGPAEEWLGIA